MINIHKLQKQIVELLEAKLPTYLTYHNIPHTLYVLDVCRNIAGHENVSGEDFLLLEVAALLHDVGHIHSSKEHELESCKIAQQILPEYGVTEQQLTKICGMIMATEIPQRPNNLLEEILADADLEYLGTNQFKPIGDRLLNELRHFNPDLSDEQWNQIQIKFMSQHKYFTNFCKLHREPLKNKHLKALIDSFIC